MQNPHGEATVAPDHASVSDDDDLVGVTVGPYTLLSKIGAGGMGAVYEALHTGLEKRVAFKTLHGLAGASARARQRFLREGRAAARVRHPNAVEVFDIGEREGVPYLVMEFLEGEDLSATLDREKRLSVARTVDLLIPVIAAVAEAHAQGVVHRDLKPENVFLSRGPRGAVIPKVLDFGVSRLVDERSGLTATAHLIGTPHYMSPEQVRFSHKATAASDQYSLGVILYECVTGTVPFPQEALVDLLEAITRHPVPPPSALRADLPPRFEAVVLRALRRDPSERFSTTAELGAALLPFASAAVRAQWEAALRRLSSRPPPDALLTPDDHEALPAFSAHPTEPEPQLEFEFHPRFQPGPQPELPTELRVERGRDAIPDAVPDAPRRTSNTPGRPLILLLFSILTAVVLYAAASVLRAPAPATVVPHTAARPPAATWFPHAAPPAPSARPPRAAAPAQPPRAAAPAPVASTAPRAPQPSSARPPSPRVRPAASVRGRANGAIILR